MQNYSKIYIVAPANSATGGPELLHQLAFKLKLIGKEVYMFYLNQVDSDPIHTNYKQYNIPYVNSIEDFKNNLLIVPETRTYILLDYDNVRKYIWWLSVDNYFLGLPKFKGLINRIILQNFNSQKYLFFNKNIKNIDFHLVQSKYAHSFLNKKAINQVKYLGDYLHESFLSIKTDKDLKENIVAYNPKKGFKFTKKIIKNSPKINFIPIENMTRLEVVNLLQKAKVYIDFGFHPGKDRIPREAAFLECCVITNKKGSASNKQDLPIRDEFKFEDNNTSIPYIINKIEDCFTNYDINSKKFNDYRGIITNQEIEFKKQVNLIFGND